MGGTGYCTEGSQAMSRPVAAHRLENRSRHVVSHSSSSSSAAAPGVEGPKESPANREVEGWAGPAAGAGEAAAGGWAGGTRGGDEAAGCGGETAGGCEGFCVEGSVEVWGGGGGTRPSGARLR